jgi:peptidoglycan hydrolase-like protein with peptidoglycan-binding domain
MKKIFSAVLALALALTVVAPVATSAQSMSTAYTFSMNLTMGSRGADVVALQSYLESKGLLSMPSGVAKGYFGGLTKTAVKAYQSMKGISPASGYFGPITRAAVASDAVMTPVNPVNPVNPTTPVVTSGVEGSVDIRLASTPADNSNIKTQNDVPVYGIEFRGRIADVSVQTVDLKVAVANAGSNENPSTLINTIKVWDGSTVLATIPVTSTTFTKDQSQVYYYRISGLNFMVPKDSTRVLTFSFSTNSIDVSRTVTIDGYNSTSVRVVSGNGVSSFYALNNNPRSHTFVKPGTSTLTLSGASSPIRSMNYRVNGSDVLENVTLGTFNLKSTSGDSKLFTVYATSTVSGTAPTTLYLYQGSTLLKSKTYASTVAFDNLDTTNGATVPGNDTNVTYTVKADFPSTTTSGSYVSVVVGSVVYEKPNGTTAMALATSTSNVAQYVYSAAPVFALAGTPTISIDGQNQSGSSTAITARFPLNITALGGTMTKLSNTSVVVKFARSDYLATTTASVTVLTTPDNNIADGTTVPVTVNANALAANMAAGTYSAYVESVNWTVGGVTVNQTYGWDDYKTPSAVTFIK